MVLTADSRRAILGMLDGSVEIMDLPTQTISAHFAMTKEAIQNILLAPNQRFLYTYSSKESKIYGWTLDTCQPLFELSLPPDPHLRISAVAPDDRSILLNTGSVISVPPQGPPKLQPLLALRSKTIHMAAYSPDGKWIASVSESGPVTLWSVDSAAIVGTAPAPNSRIATLSFRPDSRAVVTQDNQGLLQLWEIPSCRLALEQKASPSHTLVFFPQGNILAMSVRQDRMGLWDLDQGKFQRYFGPGGFASNLSLSTDGRVVLTRWASSSVRVWGTIDLGVELFSNANASLTEVSADEQLLVTGSLSGQIDVWDIATRQLLRHLTIPGSAIQQLKLAPDNRRLLVLHVNDQVQVFDLESGKALPINPRFATKVDAGAWSAKGRLSVGKSEGTEHSLLLGESEHDAAPRKWKLPAAAATMTFAPDGNRLCIGYQNGKVVLWDTSSGLPVREWAVATDSQVISALAFSAAGKYLMTGTSMGDVAIWTLEGNFQCTRLPKQADVVTSVGFGRADQWAFSACANGDVKLWDRVNAREIRDFSQRKCAPSSAQWIRHMDGMVVAFPGVGVQLYNFGLPVQRHKLKPRPGDLLQLGHWYVLHGLNDWAIVTWLEARRQGIKIDTLALAQAYWRVGKRLEASQELASLNLDNSNTYNKLRMTALQAP